MNDEMEEIWELYADDGAQALDAMEEALEALQSGNCDDPGPHIGALFRAVHTFKGNSRVLGLSVVESRAHVAEDLIGLVRDQGVELTSEILTMLLLTGDTLRGMLDETAATHADVESGPSEALLDGLKKMVVKYSGDGPIEPEPERDMNDPVNAMFASLDEAEADEDEEEEVAAAPAPPEPTPEPAPAPEPVKEAAPAPEPTPAPKAAPAAAPSADAAADESNDPSEAARRLLEDKVYHKIYSDMVLETLEHLEQTLAEAPAEVPSETVKKASGLSYAAQQLGLDEWCTLLDRLNEPGDQAATDLLAEIIKGTKKLCRRDLGIGEEEVEEVPAPEAAADGADDAAAHGAAEGADDTPPPPKQVGETEQILTKLSEVFTRVSEMGLRFNTDDKPTGAELGELSKDVVALVEEQGYVRVTHAAELLAMADTAAGFRAAELSFYEELAAVESVLSGPVPDDLLTPTRLLRIWGADNIFETLQQLRVGLEDNKSKGETWFPGFEGLMRRAFHACNFFSMDTAAQLTMALIDLFARVRVDGATPDVIIIQIARGFVDTMELVFDALDQGDSPDTAKIEKLFEEASTVCFLASGMVTAKTIEKRLGLPEEFHRVLSPESVKKAQSAIEAGLHFHVIRADLNDDESIAQQFLDWVSSDQARMITNVTVFQDDVTLFDFLIATNLPDDHLHETLAQIDPTASKLYATLALTDQGEDDGTNLGGSSDATDLPIVMGQANDGLQLLETIGEISSGQAMVQEMARQLAMTDLTQEIEMSLQHSDAPPLHPQVRTILRDIVDQHMAKLQQLSESETQLASQLTQLQEESVAMRSRPANVLLKPLGSFVEALARQCAGEARLSTNGGDVTLDQTMITDLRAILKTLITQRLSMDSKPRKFHVSVENEDDRVRVDLTDDGAPLKIDAEFAALEADIVRKGGTLRTVMQPEGGVRFHLSLPLHMIVLDGMVVRVGDVRYVLPIESIQRIHQGRDVIPVVAASHQTMLRLDDGELVKIQPLSDGRGKSANSNEGLYVIVRYGDTRRAIPVDELMGQQLVLLRPLRGVLSNMRDLSGIAILTGGDVGMVVSVSSFAAA